MARMIATASVLVILALCGAALALRSKPQTVEVTMVDYRFIPDHLTFKHDVRYRIHLENHGKETHEFTAPTFFATSKIDNPGVLNSEHTEVVTQPGETKDLFLTPLKTGTFDLRCSDHDWDGMVGGITVD